MLHRTPINVGQVEIADGWASSGVHFTAKSFNAAASLTRGLPMGNAPENSRCFVVKCAKPGVVLIHGTAYCAKHALEREQRPKERVRERELADIDA